MTKLKRSSGATPLLRETYTSDRVLEHFYEDLIRAANSRNPDALLQRIHLPHSDVFYTRNALRDKFNENFTLQYVEWAMLKEGLLSVDDCFEGHIRIRWEEYPLEKTAVLRSENIEDQSKGY